MKKLILLFLISLSYLSNLSAQNNNYNNLKGVVNQLMKAIVEGDSSKVKTLRDPLTRSLVDPYAERQSFILAKKVLEKYGLPEDDKLSFSNGRLGREKLIIADIFQKEDSVLNMKKCSLIIAFIPDNQRQKGTVGKFGDYYLSYEPARFILKRP